VKPVFKYILITIGILLVTGYLAWALLTFPDPKTNEVCNRFHIVFLDQSGVKLISEKEVAEMIDNNGLNPMGKTLRHVRTEEIEELLQKQPFIKHTECFKTPSGEVYLFLQQRHPKFRLAGNESFYVDTEKNIIPVSYNDAARLPVVSGLVTKSMAKGELFDFVSYLEENPFWNAQIEQIYIRPDRKIELVPRVGTGIILLGNLKDYEKKLDKLKILYEKGFNQFGWNYYKSIDLQYENQIVCTKIDKLD